MDNKAVKNFAKAMWADDLDDDGFAMQTDEYGTHCGHTFQNGMSGKGGHEEPNFDDEDAYSVDAALGDKGDKNEEDEKMSANMWENGWENPVCQKRAGQRPYRDDRGQIREKRSVPYGSDERKGSGKAKAPKCSGKASGWGDVHKADEFTELKKKLEEKDSENKQLMNQLMELTQRMIAMQTSTDNLVAQRGTMVSN